MSSPQLNHKTLKACIQHFTWSWHTVVMGTGSVASLVSHFHFGEGSEAVKVLTLLLFFLNLLFFSLITTATVARYRLFPETYAFAGPEFVYVLWAFWWLDCAISVLIAIGMIFVMITRQKHSLGQMSALWLFPVITMVVASSTGGLLALALSALNPAFSSLTTAVSFSLLLMGLSFAFMIFTVYLMRLVVYGPLDTSLILSSFIIMGPLGQGGFSMLVNGQNFAHIKLPAPFSPAALQSICLCAAWLLCVLLRQRVPFSITHWDTIFPNNVFALLTVQLGEEPESRILNYLGAIFSVLVFLLWIFVLVKTIPAVWNTSVFSSPIVSTLDERMPSTIEHLDD
ncbi:sulfite efflux pump SSU1 [Favolaschia claudopus]|uniref:Sulfite efflux pump SSU1 n=1 Tax=Favolaschia claudopus TaxID=2862362 RepID=A0AAW0C0V1_9AGAR